MSDFKKCSKCNEYCWIDKHKCPPEWKVFHEEYLGSDEYKTYYASDAQGAAEKYGEEYDQDDYSLQRGYKIEIQVEPLEGGERKTFIVTRETVPTYYASEK